MVGLPMLAPNKRQCEHHKEANYLQVQNVSDYWFENIPLVDTNAGKGLIMRNTAINKDRAVAVGRPDFVIRDKKEKNCLLIGAAIPNKTNVRTRSRKDYEVS